MAGIVCGKLDVTKLPQDELITINNQTWLSADVEEKFYIVDNEPRVVIKFSNACLATVCNDQQDINPSLAQQTGARMVADESVPSEGGSSQDQTRSLPSVVNSSDQEIQQARNAVDINNINIYSWYGAAVKPASAVIPMKSNIKTYGPYVSSNFSNSYGGTQVEVNTELCPWVFGSIQAMNAAGLSLVESAAIGLVKAETGSVTIPGLPLSDFSLLGMALNSNGPTLSSLNFGFGSSGITTQYEFRTYTPKFGGLNRHVIDKLKSINKNRIEQLRFLRTNQITLNKISRKIKNVENPPRDNNKPGGTLQRVMMGEIYDWAQTDNSSYTQCSIVGIDTLRKSVGEMVYDYEKKAYISLDALYGPISKNGDGNLPRYSSFEDKNKNDIKHKNSPDLPQPPFAYQENLESEEDPFISGLNQYNLTINQTYLDPLNNSFDADQHHHEGAGTGHAVDLVGRESTVPKSGIITNFYDLDNTERYSEDYRFLGMRGPILLHSWGYDTDGKPIPNASDNDEATKTGIFQKESLKDQFLKDWLGKPATWPVAPVDFRFDRKRGVWVCPPGYKVVVAKLDENLSPYGEAKATLIIQDNEHNKTFNKPLYNKDGEEVPQEHAKIKIVDRIGVNHKKNSKVYCYYDTYNSEYIILSSSNISNVRFRLIDFCENSPATPDYSDSTDDSDWATFAGYGDKFPNNHILGVRINCNGDPIDAAGQTIGDQEIVDAFNKLNNPPPPSEEGGTRPEDILINLLDTCGKHGPAYAHYGDFQSWKFRASTGFGISVSPAVSGSQIFECGLGENSTQCSQLNEKLDTYEIVFLDNYARFVECELTQKLYADSETVSQDYPDDQYKTENPDGNAAATIKYFYGGSANGKEPKFYDSELEELDFRVFDPFKDATKLKNPFAKLDEGDRVLAVFDENRKKYIIYNSLRENDSIIKFALIDNKDIGTRFCQAVLVNRDGHPVNETGEKLTSETFFSENFITVTDPFAIHGYANPPSYFNEGKTGFGPALGSSDFNEHINGIPVENGDDEQTVQNGPFIGYAISTKEKPESGSGSEPAILNQIFFLETFAQTIEGKIATQRPVVDSTYYLGALRGYINGRIPFTRDAIPEDNRLNIRIRLPLNIYYAGKYVVGDFYDDISEGGDLYNKIDGCKFKAILDHTQSTVTSGSEKLYYNIIETEHLASKVKSVILNQEEADKLNQGLSITHDTQQQKIVSEFIDGFMWDKEKSQTNYEKIKLSNRLDWIGKSLLFKWDNYENLHINSNLAGFDPDYGAIYQIQYAGTIARVMEGQVPDNKGATLGNPGSVSENELNINKFNNSVFYHGLDVKNKLLDNDAPKIKINNNWMMYDEAFILGLFNENAGQLNQSNYNIVYAREAPVIITAEAYDTFQPEAEKAWVVLTSDIGYSSCPGFDKDPIPKLLKSADNTNGYGARKGDAVTIQRVYLQTVGEDGANYKYLIIGTSSKPIGIE